jgi:hypothetical protein
MSETRGLEMGAHHDGESATNQSVVVRAGSDDTVGMRVGSEEEGHELVAQNQHQRQPPDQRGRPQARE